MARNAFGSKLSYYKSSAFVDVAEVTNISGPSVSRDSIETTHHQSTGGFREFIPGLKDAGEVSIDINWDPATTSHADLYASLTATDNGQFRITFAGTPASTFTFYGHVTGFDATAPIDDRLTASVTIKLSGQPVFA